MYFIYRRAKVARVIALLALHTSELRENVPVSEVTFHLFFFNTVNKFNIVNDCQFFTALFFPLYENGNIIKYVNFCVYSM